MTLSSKLQVIIDPLGGELNPEADLELINILHIPCESLADARRLIVDLKETLDLRKFLGLMEPMARAAFAYYADPNTGITDTWGAW
jgi:hypothetical protein